MIYECRRATLIFFDRFKATTITLLHCPLAIQGITRAMMRDEELTLFRKKYNPNDPNAAEVLRICICIYRGFISIVKCLTKATSRIGCARNSSLECLE